MGGNICLDAIIDWHHPNFSYGYMITPLNLLPIFSICSSKLVLQRAKWRKSLKVIWDNIKYCVARLNSISLLLYIPFRNEPVTTIINNIGLHGLLDCIRHHQVQWTYAAPPINQAAYNNVNLSLTYIHNQLSVFILYKTTVTLMIYPAFLYILTKLLLLPVCLR